MRILVLVYLIPSWYYVMLSFLKKYTIKIYASLIIEKESIVITILNSGEYFMVNTVVESLYVTYT